MTNYPNALRRSIKNREVADICIMISYLDIYICMCLFCIGWYMVYRSDE